MLLADYFIIRKIRSHKKRTEELMKLNERIKRYKKLERPRKVSDLAGVLSVGSIWLLISRGGNDYIDVDHIACLIEEGLRYLFTLTTV